MVEIWSNYPSCGQKCGQIFKVWIGHRRGIVAALGAWVTPTSTRNKINLFGPVGSEKFRTEIKGFSRDGSVQKILNG